MTTYGSESTAALIADRERQRRLLAGAPDHLVERGKASELTASLLGERELRAAADRAAQNEQVAEWLERCARWYEVSAANVALNGVNPTSNTRTIRQFLDEPPNRPHVSEFNGDDNLDVAAFFISAAVAADYLADDGVIDPRLRDEETKSRSGVVW